MTLKSIIKTDASGVFLVTDDFAEQVTYLPAGGGEGRTVTMIIEDDVTAVLEGGTEDHEDRAECFCLRDRYAAKGGIDQPAYGDQIIRSAAEEDDPRPYVFLGEITDKTTDTWILVFQRNKLTALAPGV